MAIIMLEQMAASFSTWLEQYGVQHMHFTLAGRAWLIMNGQAIPDVPLKPPAGWLSPSRFMPPTPLVSSTSCCRCIAQLRRSQRTAADGPRRQPSSYLPVDAHGTRVPTPAPLLWPNMGFVWVHTGSCTNRNICLSRAVQEIRAHALLQPPSTLEAPSTDSCSRAKLSRTTPRSHVSAACTPQALPPLLPAVPKCPKLGHPPLPGPPSLPVRQGILQPLTPGW